MRHTHPWTIAGIALACAGTVAATPVLPIAAPTAPSKAASVALNIELTALDMVLDLVRHGQSTDNAAGIIGTVPPGASITALGATQAAFLADPTNPQHLANPSYYDGVYASEFVRTQQTAADWLTAAGSPSTPVTVLGGLNEINAGLLDGATQTTLNGLLYVLPTLAWVFGQYWVPQIGSTIDPNGMAFDNRFTGAVDQIYENGGAVGGDGNLHDVAFAHGGSIAAWTMMNVKNPDFGLFLQSLSSGLLPNTGQVVVEGNPTDGWTLVSWNGTEVAQNPGLLTGLFVDFRDLITAPQMASWNVWEAIVSGDPSTIPTALFDGLNDVCQAIIAFPGAVIDTILTALGDATGIGSGVSDIPVDLSDLNALLGPLAI